MLNKLESIFYQDSFQQKLKDNSIQFPEEIEFEYKNVMALIILLYVGY